MGWNPYLTHRQYVAWNIWLDNQLNEPSRTDHYLMQIACEQVRSRAKHPKHVKLDKFKLTFSKKLINKTNPALAVTPEKREDFTKQIWISRMTAPITHKQEGKPDEIIIPPLLRRQQIQEERNKAARKQNVKIVKTPTPMPKRGTPQPRKRGRSK